MAILIKIDQSGKPAGVAGFSREDLDLAVAVTLTASGGVGVLEYRWSIVSAPPKDDLTGPSAAALTSTSTITTQLTPDNRGTYYVELLVDQGFGLGARPEDRDRRTFYAGPTLNADPLKLPRRILADLEELEHNVPDVIEPAGNTKGWSREQHKWYRILEGLYNSTTIVPFITGNLRVLASNNLGTAAEWVKLTYEYFSPTANIRHTMLQGVGSELLEPSGWPVTGSANDSACRIVYQNSGRQFTLDHVADYSFWVAGTRFTKTADENIVWPDVTGIHYFYFDASGIIRTTQVLSTWLAAIGGSGCPIAALQWHTSGYVTAATDERHGLMPGETHKWAHSGIGALWVSGGALTGFTIGTGSANADAQFDAEQASIRDEDIVGACVSNGSQALSPLVARTWAFVGSQWVHKDHDAFPGVMQDGANYTGGTYTAGAGRVAYNSIVGGVGSLVEVSANGRFVLAHVFATTENSKYSADGGSTDWRFNVLLGQSEYSSASTARAGALIELAQLNLDGMPTAEWVWLGTVIYQTSTAYGNSVKARVVQATDAVGNLVDYLDWRNRLNLPAGSSGAATPSKFDATFDGIVNTTGGLAKAWFAYDGVAGGSWVSAVANTVPVFNTSGVLTAATGTYGQTLAIGPSGIGFYDLPIVSSSFIGMVNNYPAGERRIFTSDGNTAGGVWEDPYDFVPGIVAMCECDTLSLGREEASISWDPANSTHWVTTLLNVTGTGPWTLTSTSAGAPAYIADNSPDNLEPDNLTLIEVDAAVGTVNFLLLSSTTSPANAWFNLSTGAVGTLSGAGAIDHSIAALGSGVYRCRLMMAGSGLSDLKIYIANTNGSANSNTGDSIVVHRVRTDVQTKCLKVPNQVMPTAPATQTTLTSWAPSVINYDLADPADSEWDGQLGLAFTTASDNRRSLEMNDIASQFRGFNKPCAVYLVARKLFGYAGDHILFQIDNDSSQYFAVGFNGSDYFVERRVNAASAVRVTRTAAGTGSWALYAAYYDGEEIQGAVENLTSSTATILDYNPFDPTDVRIGGDPSGAVAVGGTGGPKLADAQVLAWYVVAPPVESPIVYNDAVDQKMRDYIQKRFYNLSLTV